MSNFLKFGIFLIFGLSLTSCSEDTSLTDDATITAQNYGNACLKMVYPINVIISGTEISVASKKEIRAAVKNYKETSGISTKPDVSIVFPIEMTNEAGETLTVDTEEELDALRAECPEGKGGYKGERGGKKACFDLVYPLTYTIADETTITGDSREEIKRQIQEWKAENEDVRPKPTLQFPIQVITEDGEVIDVESKEALKALKAAC